MRRRAVRRHRRLVGVQLHEHRARGVGMVAPQVVLQVPRLGPARNHHAVEQRSKLLGPTGLGDEDGYDLHWSCHDYFSYQFGSKASTIGVVPGARPPRTMPPPGRKICFTLTAAPMGLGGAG